MVRHLLRQIASGIVTVFFIATATFFAMHAVPGDPLMGGKATTPEIRANLQKKYGLDRPLLEQYGTFIKNMATGDFGISFTQHNRSVNDIIRKHFPISAVLGLLAIAVAATGGVLLGSITAIFKNRAPDRLIMLLVIFGVSVPGFVVAALLQLGITELNRITQSTLGFSLLPVGGWGDPGHMVLPALALGLSTLAFLARLMRSSMLEVTNADYIRTARAKGVSPSGIFFRHQLRNAALPVVTVLGPAIAAITTGGFVVEQVFAIPGLGRYFVQAVHQLDYTVIMGLTVFYGAYLVFMVILVDLIYSWIDPRIRVGASS
jgi:ABC-type dipeptide/oligopeptide/nickel transport system permease component